MAEEERSMIFDDVFRTMAEKMPRLLIALINRAFDAGYPENVPFEQLRNEHITPEGRIITDSLLKIQGTLYHVECESDGGGTRVMLVRMIEYDFAIALEQAIKNRSLEIQLPASCVLYLRHGKSTPEHLELTLRTAEGLSVPYRVKVLKAQEPSLEEIFKKKLLIYLPYYIMRYEDSYSAIEQDPAKRERFFDELRQIVLHLSESLDEDGAENSYSMRELIIEVADHMLRNHTPLREGVDEIVGGRVLELRSERMRRLGREEGLEEGLVKGREEGREEGREQGQIVALAKLVNQGILQLADAVWSLGMEEEAFRAKAEALGCPILP